MKGLYYRIHKRNLLLIFILILCLFLAITFAIIEFFLRPAFFAVAEARVKQVAIKSIQEAVNYTARNYTYQDLVMIEKNQEGNIIMMQPNLAKINRFSSDVILAIEKKLEAVSQEEVYLPFAQVFGMSVLAGLGPRLKVRLLPLGFVDTPEIVDTFQTGGINQTRHELYLQVDVKFRVIVPMMAESIMVSSKVPINEVTLLGPVPEVYVGIDGGVMKGILDDLIKNGKLNN